jgi:hypothetical protein
MSPIGTGSSMSWQTAPSGLAPHRSKRATRNCAPVLGQPSGMLARFGSASLVGGDNSSRGMLQLFQAVQQSANAAWVPFAAPCRLYFSLVQLTSNGLDGDKARFPKFTNCRANSLSPHVCDPLACPSIVAVAGRDQAQARQHPRDSGAMPSTAKGGRYPSSVQFIRQLTLGNEASRYKLPNGRGQNSGAEVCGPLIR